MRGGVFRIWPPLETVCNHPHHGADAFGFLKRTLHHLLHAVLHFRALAKSADILSDLADVESQRSQWPVELMCDSGSHFVRRPRSLRRWASDFKRLALPAPIHPFRVVWIVGSIFFLPHSAHSPV